MAESDNPARAGLDPEQLTIGDLLNESQIQSMRDTFAHSTGIEVVVAKTEQGKFLASPRIYYFCRELMNIPEFNAACMKCYMGTRANLDESKDYNIDYCHLGFYTYGASIWFKDQVVALLGGCMVKPSKALINRGRLKAICRQYGYAGDFKRLFKSLDEFPVLDIVTLKKQLEIFREMARAVSEIAKRQYLLIEDKLQQERLSRYFSPSVYDLVSSGESSKTWKGRATVLFSDIRDFTAMSEAMPPEAVVEMLNEYFGLMVEIVFKYRGTLDKFIGDAMLVVFGAPVRIDNSEDAAVKAAMEMLSALEKLNARKTARGEEPIRIGIGIHTGEIIAGNIGSAQRTDFTIIGDTVNMASRLESATKLFDERIVVSEETYKKLTDKSLIKGKSLLRVKGKKDDQVIYRI